jgi:hypothetical protein
MLDQQLDILDRKPIRACLLGELRWSTPLSGDASENFDRFKSNEERGAKMRGI